MSGTRRTSPTRATCSSCAARPSTSASEFDGALPRTPDRSPRMALNPVPQTPRPAAPVFSASLTGGAARGSRLERLKAAPRKAGEASFFFYDAHFKNEAVKVLPGEYYVDNEDLLVMTTLGSCIAACLWDRQARIGGMNHFMLPEGSGDSGRYGSYAMELLINEMMKRGASRLTMEAKIFGGGAVISGMNSINVGERNTKFVMDFLATERIPIVSKDVLDVYPRKVCFLPASGKAMVKRLAPTNTDALVAQEKAAAQRDLPASTGGGSIDLFCPHTHAAPREQDEMAKTRVVVVDDSALVRSLLTEIVNRQSDMECIGSAADPFAAREMIRNLNPDVITLDVEMPRMDGLDFLARLMRLRPMPVVMVSTLTERGAEVTLKALELGAVDFVAKPKIGVADGIRLLAQDITDKIRIAAKAHIRRAPPPPAAGSVAPAPAKPVTMASLGRASTEKLIFIGASTGGTEATKDVLVNLPADSPAVVITQHMPPGFTKSYAARLDGLCKIRVKEAQDGERILPGHGYIAPGGFHLTVERSGANYIARVQDGEPVNRHKPSVEALFLSAAKVVGQNAIGIMLTGMGADGARAMKVMKDAGSYNYCQDEASCVVFGMPREAIAAGAADEVLPLNQIAGKVLERLRATSDRK